MPSGTRDIDTGGRGLRRHAARGTLINSAFTVGVSLIALVRGFVLAALLTTQDYGVWGLLTASLGTLMLLKQIGINDKYIQQDDPDQEHAFQKAFTLEAIFTGIFTVVLLVALPVYALAYGEPKIIGPGVLVVLVLPAGALQAPLWIFYRNMDFLRQRMLLAIDPVVGLGVAVVLALAGAGYWSFAVGLFAGAWGAALVALAQSPYRVRFRYDRGTLRQYFQFSWPLFVASGSGVVIAQTAVLTLQHAVGLAAVGAVALAYSLTSFTERVDQLVTETLYPAICAVRDRLDLLEESFVKSNRLGLMWAVPFGCGLGLFAHDLVSFVIGEKWRLAADLLAVTGFNAALAQVAFNWDAYMRALDRTRPMATAALAAAIVFVALGVPLIISHGLDGLLIAIAAQSAVHLVVRIYYLRGLFKGFRFLRHALRAALPTLPAVAAVLVVRAFEHGERSSSAALIEAAVYVSIVAAATWVTERSLLREMLGYFGAPPSSSKSGHGV